MISVIIPTYNREKTIKRALDSVLNQTYNDIEVIIVDDGSVDNTKGIIDTYEDSRIRYIKQKNGGAASARNKGIKKAKGQYIAFQDSDDYWYSDKLQKQLDILISSGADISFCKLNRNNYGDNTEKIWPLIDEGFVTERMLIMTPMVSTQTLFGKAEVFKNNLFDTELPALEDYAFSFVVASKYKMYHHAEVLVDLYLQEDSLTSNMDKYIDGYKKIISKYNNIIAKYPDCKSKLLQVVAGLERDKGINNTEYLKEAFILDKNIKTFSKYILAKLKLYSHT